MEGRSWCFSGRNYQSVVVVMMARRDSQPLIRESAALKSLVATDACVNLEIGLESQSTVDSANGPNGTH